ncbi:hypothetical protein BU24DRAFT_480282 [Aaosphaeria arxii CBS 175.79]|uniref:Dynamin N-terminal domain-containing protein n=1 Tax=Aaosphaeria arxii CBS 175.79 TaxID=1450172 RepID=A0A6A5XQG3_9PLEO|nr:uncharacterized protein BU24DRAFT_480282 [Aaosphaeria arxii CBS 175.79]KAF2015535.1 hypothetical protein BU24DRAFT_480282 [Aaosphaeria arxii CBS 175.79]
MAPGNLLDYAEFSSFYKKNRLILRYDSTGESKIQHDWWALDHDEISRKLREISDMTTSVMEGVPRDDLEVQALLDMGESIYKIKRSKTFNVALSGPQGAGKSTFLNSLLDCPGLCLSASDGGACTNAVIRYVYYQGATEHAVRAEIRFHHPDRMKEIVEDHSQAFYHFNHFTDEIENENDSDDEAIQCKRKKRQHDEAEVKAKDTAQDIFETVFGGKEKFKEAWSPEGFQDGSFQREAVRKCLEAVYKVNSSDDGVVVYNGESVAELSKKLRPFTTKVDNEFSLWPLVDIISYGLNRELLKQGFEFIDLPGWGDRNALKERHADEVRSAVDLEIILVDTIRITTEDSAINKIRAALHGRGAEGVIIAATKVDSLQDNELDTCEGEDFNYVNSQVQWAAAMRIEALDDGDDEQDRLLTNYSAYLNLQRKAMKHAQRRASINLKFNGKFEDIIGTDDVRIFHISATEYLKWITRPKYPYAQQPELSPEDTGVPALRKYLFDLPAASNLRDWRYQVFNELDSFLEKIDRVVNEKDRSEGFKTLAADFAAYRTKFRAKMQKGIGSYLETSLENLMSDPIANSTFRDEINNLVQSQWLKYPYGAFNRVLRDGGCVTKGMSQAQSLVDGVDWNKDLPDEFTTILNFWRQGQREMNGELRAALTHFYRQFHAETQHALQHANSDLTAISIAKARWLSYKKKLLSSIELFIKELQSLQSRLYKGVLMIDGRKNTLVPILTTPLFAKIYRSLPATRPKSTPKKRLYVEPKTRFQKKCLLNEFCNPVNHIFDQVMRSFQKSAKIRFDSIFEGNIQFADAILANFQQKLQDLVPVPYEVTHRGQSIRDSLQDMLPDLRTKAAALQGMVPVEILDMSNTDDDSDLSTHLLGQDLSYFIDKARAARSQSSKPSVITKPKRKEVLVKQEEVEEDECLFTASFQPSKKRKLN